MKPVFRWFGKNNDTVTLSQIKQIPRICGIVWSLHNKNAGDVWLKEEIAFEKSYIESYGFNIDVVESMNIHESIKLGLKERDKYIENYISSIKNLSDLGVKVICYNFMPVFDWLRTDFYKALPDNSTAMFFEKSKIKNISPRKLADIFLNELTTFTLPGWEKENLAMLTSTLEKYENITENDLFKNLKYFLDAIIPTCEKYNIKMAIHPDDPPFSIFSLPRIVNNYENIKTILSLNKSYYNGLTLCTGSLGSSKENNIENIISLANEKIHFAHIRNILRYENGDFIETAHAEPASIDIASIMKKLFDIGFNGYIRPDHGRNIWNEKCRPGYGLYDRALGIMYLIGLWDGFSKGV